MKTKGWLTDIMKAACKIQKIKVKDIEPELAEHFDPNGKSLGKLNYYESLDLRVQIKKAGAEGYWIKFPMKGYTDVSAVCNIDKDGRVNSWPDGLYDKIDNLLMELI